MTDSPKRAARRREMKMHALIVTAIVMVAGLTLAAGSIPIAKPEEVGLE